MKHLLAILILSLPSVAQSITAPTLTAPTMDKVGVSIEGLTGANNLIAVQWTLYYDDAVIHAVSDNPPPNVLDTWGCTSGSIIGNANIYCNGRDPGVFYIAIIAPYGFTGSGTLVDIPFKTIKGDTDLDLEDVQFYTSNGPVKVDVADGGITLE